MNLEGEKKNKTTGVSCMNPTTTKPFLYFVWGFPSFYSPRELNCFHRVVYAWGKHTGSGRGAVMDLYLVSPVFLKRLMMQRPSGNPVLEDCRVIEAALPSRHSEVRKDEGEDEEELLRPWHGRRRSSLDRMLRQHAYIIICMLCYTCSLVWSSS